MKIWKTEPLIAEMNKFSADTMMTQLGIEFTEAGDDYLKAVMPVDHRTHQPLGLLHGGASVALAETIGSVGAFLCIDHDNYYAVGLEINANHLRQKKEGLVTGTGKPVYLGRTVQVWEIRITDEQDKLICISRITMSVIKK